MIEATNKALVRRWFDEVWNNRQEGTVDKLMASYAVAHGLGDSDMQIRGPGEFKIFLQNMLDSFPDLHISVEDIFAEEDKVMVSVLLVGTHQGVGLGIPATGRRISVAGIVLVRIKDGQIVEGWNSWDQLGLLRQIGAIPMPAGSDQFLRNNSSR